jgi:hypothetical protein
MQRKNMDRLPNSRDSTQYNCQVKNMSSNESMEQKAVIRRDHPSWRGALILSANIDRALTPLAPQ